jgi:hypothetical protein
VKAPDQLSATQDRHHQIRDHDIREWVRLNDFERSFAVGGLNDDVARSLENQAQKGSSIGVVIDDQDGAQPRTWLRDNTSRRAVSAAFTVRQCRAGDNKISNFPAGLTPRAA